MVQEVEPVEMGQGTASAEGEDRVSGVWRELLEHADFPVDGALDGGTSALNHSFYAYQLTHVSDRIPTSTGVE